MEISKDSIIGALVAQDYRVATAFKKKGIDFCCNGNRSIAEVCSEHNLESEQLIQEIQATTAQTQATAVDYQSWPLDLLADYIEKKHHRFVTAKIEEITPYLEKINRVHGERHPELSKVEELFKASAGELSMHMKKEELMFFPRIRKMMENQQAGTMDKEQLQSLESSISSLMQEHDNEGERFRQIEALTNGYTAPEDGCNTYRVSLALLKEFEDDLHLHIHLENNILFPKSAKMAAELTAQ